MQLDLDETRLQKAAVIFGVITFGLSQSFYGLILTKPAAFPQNIAFAAWVLVFIQIIPFLILLGLDGLLRRNTPTRIFRIWRTVLGALLILSLLRQFHVFYPSLFNRYLSFLPAIFVYSFIAGGTFLVFLKWSRGTALYLYYLGICSIALPIYFLIQSHSMRYPHFMRKNSAVQAALTPVIVVVFDELSLDVLTQQGRMDRTAFPNFAAFAEDSIWFRNATTNHWSTVDSLPSFITSRVHAGQARTLFELLPEYTSIVVSSEIEFENWLLSESSHRGVKRLQGKSYYLSYNPLRTLQYVSKRLLGYFLFSAAENIVLDDPAYHVSLFDQIEQCKRWIHSTDSILLLWHPTIPHSPFLFEKDGKKHHQRLNYFPFEREYDPSKFDSIFQLYRRQTQFTDRVLGKFLSELKQSGLYNRSIIVVTSDHGLRVWGDIASHGEIIARIPFLMKIPGQSSRVEDKDFQLIDFAPTLMEALGRSPGAFVFEGISGGSESHRDKITYFHPATFVYDSKNQAWMDSSTSRQMPSMVGDRKKRLARNTFSSTYVWDDLFTAEQEKRDFLQLYLKKDFPIHIKTSELEKIYSTIAKERAPQTPRDHFKLGMNYFYAAIWDTFQISQGRTADIELVNQNWQKTVQHLQMAGHLSPLLQQNINRFLTEADSNKDGKWSEIELTRMIHDRMNR